MAILGPRLDKSLVNELAAHVRRHVSVLAHGTGAEASLLGTREFLALRSQGTWRTFGWEEVAKGSWRTDTSTFSWTTTGGEDVRVHLDDVGRLPELFKERVQASTVVTLSHDLPRGRVQVTGRRKLDGSDEITWYAVAGGGADLADEAVAALVVSETDRLKAEYDV